MRDLRNPLGVSLFDGEKPPKEKKTTTEKKPSRARKKNARRNARNRTRNAPEKSKSKFGEARGIKTKTEEKGPVYVSKKQQAKTCSGSAKGGGFKECGRD